ARLAASALLELDFRRRLSPEGSVLCGSLERLRQHCHYRWLRRHGRPDLSSFRYALALVHVSPPRRTRNFHQYIAALLSNRSAPRTRRTARPRRSSSSRRTPTAAWARRN